MSRPRIIVLEFNELCPDLLRGWMAAGKLPNFKRFHDNAVAFSAAAETTDLNWLEPWIQWYSMHTGLGCDQHAVRHLTDGPRMADRHTDIWHALLAAGITVANCGSMNAASFNAPGSLFLPDPWCTTQPPHPAELSAYHRLVLSKVQENSNQVEPLGRKDYVEFLRFVAMHGLSTRSVLAVLQQLTAEGLGKGAGWKRAALLDKLQADIFAHYWKRLRPQFSTFFLNSTAHFQHAYLHFLELGESPGPVGNSDDPKRDAILFGFQQMDALLADFFALERHGVMLVLATGLGQQHNPNADRHYYRPRDMAALMQLLSIAPSALLPTMSDSYSAEFPDQDAANIARQRLEQVKLADRALFQFSPTTPRALYFNIGIRSLVPPDAVLRIPSNQQPHVPFYDLCYRIPHSKSGVHHPDSVLWFKTGRHQVPAEKVSILDMFPTLLDYFGAPMPRDQGGERRGRSLVAQLDVAPAPGSERLAAVA